MEVEAFIVPVDPFVSTLGLSLLSYGESQSSARPQGPFMVIRERDPPLHACSSVGSGLEEQCGLDFRLHSLAHWAIWCSVQPAQLHTEALNERETRRHA